MHFAYYKISCSQNLSEDRNFSVKIMSVSIEKGNITTIEIIRGQPELISCITSIGRPQATIRWHKFFNGTEITLTDTHKTEIIPNGKGYVETKSFLKLNVTRDDNGWDLHCSAYNVDGMEPLNAVNRIKINVLCKQIYFQNPLHSILELNK